MKILQRYVLLELLKTFLMTMFIITLVMFLGTALQIVRKYSQFLSLLDIIEISPYLLMSATAVTMPIALLAATTLCYGRLAQDREIMILRISGVHLHTIVAPVILIGALCSIFSFHLHAHLVPLAYQKKRAITHKAIEILLKASLPTGETTISFIPNVKIFYRQRRGTMFKDLLIQRLKELTITQEVVAAYGELRIDPQLNQIVFDLQDGCVTHMIYTTRNGKAYKQREEKITFQRLSVPIHLPDKKKRRHQRLKYQTLEQIVAFEIRIKSKIETATAIMEQIKAKAQHDDGIRRIYNELRDRRRDDRCTLREIRTEYHKRLASPLGTILVVLIGAPLGIMIRQGNKLVAFGISALPIVLIYYPLMVVGEILGQNGVLPPAVAVWGSVVITLMIGFGLLTYIYRQ